ncbi:MAG: 2-oxo acid dehydrogenase subunit E2 [Planctomycetes bacterium]|nr:2-oxo acid dehydrogenase subunit E2 [Planctomycetota bacterium]
MIKEVLMPKLGQTVEEAVVERWHKKEGDLVQKGEVLLEITTDKATLEVESFVEGTLRKIIVPEGTTVAVNTVLAYVGGPGDPLPESRRAATASGPSAALASAPAASSAASSAPAASSAAASAPAASSAASSAPVMPSPAPAMAASTGRIAVSPRARRRARDMLIPFRFLRGSGPGGRIIEQDVLEYARRRDQLRITPVALRLAFEREIDVLAIRGSGPGGKITREDVEPAPRAAAPAGPAAPAPSVGRRVPLTAMRRIIAQRMAESKATVPHFYLDRDVDMTALIVRRSELNASGTVKISFNDLLIRACVLAFEQVPLMNVSWGGDALLYRDSVDIGLAVAVEEGLLVPVVRDLNRKSVERIAQESQALIEKARTRRLTPDDYGHASMTVSNLGMYEVDRVFPIINPGESCILGVGRIGEKVVVRHGGIHIRSLMSLVLACDHRVVDGVIGARFLHAVRDALENPAVLSLKF